MKKQYAEKFGTAILICFLFSFMLLIFGPTEIFFANMTEFEFLYQEFIWYMIGLTVACTLIAALLIAALPSKAFRVVLSLVFGVSLAGYLQVMFLNKGLDLLGLNPEGYQVGAGKMIGNILFWIVIVAAVVVLAFWKDGIWKKLITYMSVFLTAIQLVALVSLVVTADEGAYKRPAGELRLSGEEQFTVSGKENVIIIILDFMSNAYVEETLVEFPDAVDALHDFTCYSNADCVYFGTFPSIIHMVTGYDFEPEGRINDWCAAAWNSDMATAFYTFLQEKQYKTNLYTPDRHMVCGGNDISLLGGKLSNVTDAPLKVDINTGLLLNTLAKMSAYRMAPELLKNCFYTNMGEYSDIVTERQNRIYHDNAAFYAALCEERLKKDSAYNYFIVQHLMGAHQRTTGADGNYKDGASLEETVRGCMVLVEEYLNQLRELGVYDNATIIVTADHGGPNNYDSQVCFFMKQADESHDRMVVNSAPISHCELLPTVICAVGGNASEFGQTIFDFAEDEERERTFWISRMNYDYPYIQCYTGDKEAAGNVYNGYRYIGNINDLISEIEQGPDIIAPMLEGFY